MQECLHLTKCQQCRFLFCWLCKVHHHAYMRTHILHVLRSEWFLRINAFLPLSLIFCHPCTALLTLTWVEVGIEYSKERSVLIKHLVCLNIWMIYWYILILLECDAVQAVSQTEHAINNLRQFEVRTQHLGIDIILLKLQFVRVVREVPWLKFEVFSLHLASHLFDSLNLFHCSRLISLDKIVQQFIHIANVTCHTVLQHIVSIGLMPQQLCYLTTQVYQAFTYFKVILLVIVYTLCVLGHIQLLAQLALS